MLATIRSARVAAGWGCYDRRMPRHRAERGPGARFFTGAAEQQKQSVELRENWPVCGTRRSPAAASRCVPSRCIPRGCTTTMAGRLSMCWCRLGIRRGLGGGGAIQVGGLLLRLLSRKLSRPTVGG